MKKELVVHSMQELVELLKGMKDTENISIRVDYGKDGDSDAAKSSKRAAIAG